ncbi:hypothetical protein K7432_007456 [Basidiobolus ranarum]|uniref:Uncharacterized protein n=1 Tax=Basidiobolus ranarum TaxID=34480 RepID=A0ABR2WTB5_9FUNG
MDTNWCTVCDKHIDFDGLYCSQKCRMQDATANTLSSPILTYGNRRPSVCSIRSPSTPNQGPSSPPLLPYSSEKLSPSSFSIGQNFCGRADIKTHTFAKRLYVL